jgi:demethylmenaquinone methyltransferase / 2-methoxy-6-polyprenyl-1,4-benzoquinol methylase
MNPASPEPDRFAPHATREIGGMFDDVSGRYDLLNRIMSLGQDRAWRRAMARAIPEDARTVLDLATGSGVSLDGLRRPGRLVIGADLSLGMLEVAAARNESSGWAPRLVCADGFRLPFRDHALDGVTIAFGIRNMRPLADALAELARVLRPGGTLAVLEAAAPAPGPFAPIHAWYLRHLVPLAGRMSPDPSAYAYLSRSIFEFGSGPEFEAALDEAGFARLDRRRFLLGASRLWVARRAPAAGQNVAPAVGAIVQNARTSGGDGVNMPIGSRRSDAEWRAWTAVQLALSAALTAALVRGLVVFINSGPDLPLDAWQRRLAWWLLVGGSVAFAIRTLALLLRLRGPAPRG